MFEFGRRGLRAASLAAFAACVVFGGATSSHAAANVSGTQTPGVVRPGDRNAELFTFSIANTGLLPITFTAITFDIVTVGPGTLPDFAAEFQAHRLYRDDGDGVFEPTGDTLLSSGTPAVGNVNFFGFSNSIVPLFPAKYFVAIDASLVCRDGDVLDLQIAAGSRLQFSGATAVTGSFPLAPSGGLLVDGMSSAQIPTFALADTVVAPGSKDVLAFDFLVLPNGYENDVLEELRFENLGTMDSDDDVKKIEIWYDRGDGAFDAGDGDDANLGEANWDGTVFELKSIGKIVSGGGLRLFAAAELDDDAPLASTLRLAILGPSDKGVYMASSNDGPLDAQVVSPRTIKLSPTTITAFASPQSGATLRPGQAKVPVFDLGMFHQGGEAETLDAVTFTNATSGPGTVAQLDAEWAPLSLRVRHVSAGGGLVSIVPQTVTGVSFASGAAKFTNVGLILAPGDSATLSIDGAPSLVARDGDFLDLNIADAAGLEFSRTVNVNATFPIAPASRFPVDGMSAAQISLQNPAAASLLTGSTRNVVLSALVPANGYSADFLSRLDVRNVGTALSGEDLTRLEAWTDDGDNVFETAGDTNLGQLYFTGDRWQITGLVRPVPVGGLRVFLTCDIAADANSGRTVRLILPTLPDVALGMVSANDGPIDASVTVPDAWTQTITTADRVVVAPHALASQTASPGELALPLLHVVFTNTYTTPRTLTQIAVTNTTRGSGSIAERDAEMQSVELRLDANSNDDLGDTGEDPLLSSSFFGSGRALFGNLDLVIPGGSSLGLFVAANVSLSLSTDGDSLACVVASSSDLTFGEGAALSGVFPVSSDAPCPVDGMIAAQVKNNGAPARTLGPSEGPALAFDAVVPANGYAADLLRGITFVNGGTAAPSDFTEVRLWRDGGDGAFDAGLVDDASLGPLTEIAGSWTSPILSEAIDVGGLRLFASMTSSSTPTDSATVRLEIPIGGLLVESGNDGPLDEVVRNPETQLLSTAALLASIEIDPLVSVVGAPVALRVEVRNAGLAAVDGIAPSALSFDGAGALTLVSGPTPSSFSLAPQEVGTFEYSLVAGAAGELRASASVSGTEAGSGFTRQSLTTTSNPHIVYDPATGVDLFPVESMPFSINRGQTDVVPLTLTLAHPGGASVAPIRVLGFSIMLENDVGGGIVPADLLSRVVVNEGATHYLNKTALETTGSTIDLTFTTPVLLDASGSNGGQTTLGLALDISDSTLVPNFRIAILDSTMFTAVDAVSGAPIDVVLRDGAYPIRSGLARVVSEATKLDVTSAPDTDRHVGIGQDDVPLFAFDLVNPDPGGLASDVRLGTFDAQLVDSAGVVIADPSLFLERIRVRTPFQQLLDRPVADDSTMTLVLSPILSIPVNAPLRVTVYGDIASGAQLGVFRTRAGVATSFDARDANTGNPVPVLYPSGTPQGPSITVEIPADLALVAGAPKFPASAPVGAGDLPAFEISLQHPGGPGAARIRCDSLTIALRDDRGVGLVPASVLDGLRILRSGVVVGVVTTFPTSGDDFVVSLANVIVDPGSTETLEVRVDLEATAPATFLELVVGAADVHARDANLGTLVVIQPAAGTELPIRSGLLRIESPARLLVAGFESLMPPVLVAGGAEVTAARFTLTNPASLAASAIEIANLVILATNRDESAIAIGSAARAVSLLRDGTLWARVSGIVASDSMATLVGADPLSIEPGETVEMELRFETADVPTASSVRLGADANSFGVVQPASALLSIAVQARDGESFPFRSLAGSFTPSTLRESYSNFPNPFAAGREETTFAFFLRENARVELRVLTARGEEVADLFDEVPLGAGLHQSMTWDGRNERGDTVVSGVYVAELSVHYEDGAKERELRKIAVVR